MVSMIWLTIITLLLMAAFFVLRNVKEAGKPAVYRKDYQGRDTDQIISPATPDKYPARKFAWIALALIPFVVLMFSITTVEANKWQVRTSFGKPTDRVIGSGLSLVAPWTTGTSFSSANQYIRFKSDPKEDEIQRIHVRLAGQSSADLTGVISYTQPKEKIKQLFMDWKTEDRIRNLYIETEAKQAISEALSTYDPLAETKQKEDALSFFSTEATKKLNERVGNVMTNVKIGITDIDYDDKTEERLGAIQAAVAETRIAVQAALTAEEIANANKKIAASLSSDPVVAFYQCSAMWAEVIRGLNTTVTSVNISGICANTIGAVR